MLPQLLIAGRIKAMVWRKWAWAAGSLGQGVCVAGMVLGAATLGGAVAGAAIFGLLAILALCRSVCSVSNEDVLGKTVEKTQRGQTTGKASMAASVTVIAFAGVLIALHGQTFALVVGAASAGLATISVPLVIGLFAVMCMVGGILALKLDEVEHA